MGIIKRGTASTSYGSRAERLEAERLRRTRRHWGRGPTEGEQRATSRSHRWMVPVLGVLLGTGGLVAAFSSSGASVCSVGMGTQINTQIFRGSSNNLAPVTT